MYYIYVCICMHVCMYVLYLCMYMYACMYGYMHACIHTVITEFRCLYI